MAEGLLNQRRIEEALVEFNRAEREGYDPDLCSAGRWTCLMLAGEFERAWRESDLISGRGKPDRHRFWDGKSVAGHRVLIRCLHGLGDTIQFIRYAPLLRRCASRVIIEAQPMLKELLSASNLADEVITWSEREPVWDQQIEVTELPRIFRTTIHSIPAHVPYLFVPGSSSRPRTSAGLRVGLVWSSSMYDPARTIPLETMAEICSISGARFCSLQADPDRRQLLTCPAPVLDLFESSIVTAAKNLHSIDLLISVDTMMAHLAGALGRPVWTLLPYQADWRWMLGREDSPWYPTMRLFRQNAPGDWRGVIARLKQMLQNTAQAVTEVAGVTGVERGSAVPGRVK